MKTEIRALVHELRALADKVEKEEVQSFGVVYVRSNETRRFGALNPRSAAATIGELSCLWAEWTEWRNIHDNRKMAEEAQREKEGASIQ